MFVNAGEDHVLNAALFKDVPHLVAAVADEIGRPVDHDLRRLTLPRQIRISPLACKPSRPRRVFARIVVFAAIGLVDRIGSLFLGGDFRAPQGGIGQRLSRGRRVERSTSGRVIGVGRHAVARRVNDRRATTSRLGDHRVQPWEKLFHPPHGVQAVMSVPDVADDHRRLRRVPLLGDQLFVIRAGASLGLDLLAKREFEFVGSRAGRLEGQGGDGHGDQPQSVKSSVHELRRLEVGLGVTMQ
ncbi:MAG TPA: hypothetical protein PLV92_11570 [Pirellulaceae bacterium]|nr:hypothetical protein [Pirellulaceae bacterium]